ncbi:divisome protein SepX/GlpR [Streptacidiphilus anmyonensis]|uniref:divisome protein SepX/GlpR n=1 Tax=Streptacidiphilus anmyonensis TaxID=405782 RepID=UPI0005AA5FED|nr:gephyrin-like molybdotransferase receptor GlpR [Streptacidiphilus anmyonensis]
MSSSGLIYAVIVGAWAAYLVPMWLRRQDELNEARPTERFSTAIRLLSGRAAMERKISRQLEETQPLAVPTPLPRSQHGAGSAAQADHTDHTDHIDDTDQARPADRLDGPVGAPGFAESAVATAAPAPASAPGPAAHHSGPSPAVASRRRAALLARRRRMVIILFAAFTAGMVIAAVGGIALLWIPAVPAVLFSVYIAQMRRQEHRRYEVKLDRRRAAEAAQRVRQQAAARREATAAAATQETGREASREASRGAAAPGADVVSSGAAEEIGHSGATTSGTGTLGASRTDSWADDDRPEHAGSTAPSTDHGDQGWDPVPVPLPTYVTAPVAPRATLGLDLSAPDTYSSARARQTPPPQQGRKAQTPAPRRPAPKPATPLFDQYAEDTPRAANE